jgi:hypothetical protein
MERKCVMRQAVRGLRETPTWLRLLLTLAGILVAIVVPGVVAGVSFYGRMTRVEDEVQTTHLADIPSQIAEIRTDVKWIRERIEHHGALKGGKNEQ